MQLVRYGRCAMCQRMRIPARDRMETQVDTDHGPFSIHSHLVPKISLISRGERNRMIRQAYRIKAIPKRHCSVQFPGIYLVTLDKEVLFVQLDSCEAREQHKGVHKSLLCQRGHSYGLDTMRLRRRWRR